MNMPLIRLSLTVLLPLLATACSSLLNSNKPPVETFWLEPLAPIASATANAPGPGLTLSLDVVPGLDTDRVLTLGPDARLNHYAGARWADNLPELLESLIRRSVAGAGRFSSVNTGRRAEHGGCLLQLEAQEFFSILNDAGETRSVEIKMQGRFECASALTPVRLNASVPVRQQSMSSIVAGYQQGIDEVLESLLVLLQGDID